MAFSSLVVGYLFRENRGWDHILNFYERRLPFFPHIWANIVGGLLFLGVGIWQKKK